MALEQGWPLPTDAKFWHREEPKAARNLAFRVRKDIRHNLDASMNKKKGFVTNPFFMAIKLVCVVMDALQDI